jgi:endo-1,4-beta-xylanase
VASANVKLRCDSTDISPAYVNNITDPDELKAVLKEHIDAVLGRYGNDLYAFDVVNERGYSRRQSLYSAFYDNGTLRDSVWLNVLGEDYFGIAVSQYL